MTRFRRGLSLVEVLIATIMLVVVFVPLFRLFLSGVSTTKSTEDRLRAFSLAQRQIEIIKHASTINRHSHAQLTTVFADAGGFKPYLVDKRFTVQTFVDPDLKVEANGRNARLCSIRVKVDWKIKGIARELEIETRLDRSYR